MFTFIILLIIILAIFAFSKNRIEKYLNTAVNKYVKLNKFGRVDSVYTKPPQPNSGESRCDQTICPQWIPDEAICYVCR
jgi:hypothetical protein